MQVAIIHLDVYSVHISKDFRTFLKNTFQGRFKLVYVPAGTTGIAQVADVCLNR